MSCRLKTDYCFSTVFDKYNHLEKHSATYTVYLYKGLKYLKSGYKNNSCFMTADEIAEHLRETKKIFSFDFEIKEYNKRKFPVFVVTLELKNLPGAFHKYLLTWLRYAYEYPNNMLLMDAYKLREVPSLENTPVRDIMNVIQNTVDQRHIHSIIKNQDYLYKPISCVSLRNKLNKCMCLHDLYQSVCGFPDKLKLGSFGSLFLKDIEYWENEDCYAYNRRPKYLELIELLESRL